MTEEQLIQEIKDLRELLRMKEAELTSLRRSRQVVQDYGLNNEEISRYSRQMFLSEFGVEGQKKVRSSSVLIVGAGGLGCPAALYLTSAGVGRIGIVDYDHVEINNLHRQILFTEADIGSSKAVAAAQHLTRINSNVQVIPHESLLSSDNALDVMKDYDIIVDATDNVATRYLLNDACVLLEKPLVSGSALRYEGQASVYNYNGPCYRCIFPKPPPPDAVTNCGDAGVLGPVVGAIGALQALEVLKIILKMPGTLSGRFLLFDGTETFFRNVKLSSKKSKCEICGENRIMKKLIDYEEFCSSKANDKNPNLNLLERNDRITVEEYHKILYEPHLLIDVRSPEEYKICRLKKSINIPLGKIAQPYSLESIEKELDKIEERKDDSVVNVFLLCRRGNDSQKAVTELRKCLNNRRVSVKDLIGGIHAWSKNIDPTIPIY